MPQLPLSPGPYPDPRPFVWFPLAGQRHAIDRRDRNVPLDTPMRCLCGATHPRGADGEMEWLWRTCELCWDQACKIVGVRGDG
ncbi:MAG: zinc finger protein [Pseudonocardiaceae bacterium]